MSKRGKGKKGKAAFDSDDEDAAQAHLDMQSAAEALEEEEEQDSFFDVDEALQHITDKKTSKRDQGLKNLINDFRSNSAIYKSASAIRDELTPAMARILRHPSSVKESTASLLVVRLLGLFVGAGEEEFFDTFQKRLLTLVSGSVEVEGIREQALMCLAFLSFVCSDESKPHVLNLCEDIITDLLSNEDNQRSGVWAININATSPSLVAQAADAWVLVASAMSAEDIIGRSRGGLFQSVTDVLEESTQVPVKVSMGKLLAFLWESAQSLTEQLEDMHVNGGLLCEDGDTVLQVVNKLKSISRESSKRVSKKDRKEQRSEFRDIEDRITKGECFSSGSDHTIRFQGAVLNITSFSMNSRVEALRATLGGNGFHSCLHQFPVTQEILEIEEVTEHMDGDGSNMRASKAELKSRAKGRTADRQSRAGATFFDGEF